MLVIGSACRRRQQVSYLCVSVPPCPYRTTTHRHSSLQSNKSDVGATEHWTVKTQQIQVGLTCVTRDPWLTHCICNQQVAGSSFGRVPLRSNLDQVFVRLEVNRHTTQSTIPVFVISQCLAEDYWDRDEHRRVGHVALEELYFRPIRLQCAFRYVSVCLSIRRSVPLSCFFSNTKAVGAIVMTTIEALIWFYPQNVVIKDFELSLEDSLCISHSRGSTTRTS